MRKGFHFDDSPQATKAPLVTSSKQHTQPSCCAPEAQEGLWRAAGAYGFSVWCLFFQSGRGPHGSATEKTRPSGRPIFKQASVSRGVYGVLFLVCVCLKLALGSRNCLLRTCSGTAAGTNH